MAQTVAQSPGLDAMAISIQAVIEDLIVVADIGLTSDGSSVQAPLFQDKKIVLDLTPREDDWLPITMANAETITHYEGESPKSLCIAVKVSDLDAYHLDLIDAKIREASGHKPIQDRVIWRNMHVGEGTVVLSLVLEDTAVPTPLRFIVNGEFKKGTGQAFLDECRGDVPWENIKCKAKVLLECIHQTADYVTVTVTVLSIIFATTPKRAVVDYSAEEEAMALRSAKRFKYQF